MQKTIHPYFNSRFCLNIILCFFYWIPGYASIDYLGLKDVQSIYSNHVKPNITDEYKHRYTPLPLHKNNTYWQWEDKDFPRVIAVLEFELFITKNNISSKKALALNDISDPEWDYLSTQDIQRVIYNEFTGENDLHALDLPEKDFDFVMVNQTLEHVYDPIRCLKNIYNHMCPGGVLYFNVPVNSIPHATPFHYYTGYTPVGLGAVVKAAGFKILSIGQWGNLEYLTLMHKTNGWPDYRQLKNPGINQIDHPVITWIFAMKE